MQYVSAYFESISNVLVSSVDIVLGFMEEEREYFTDDITFYFLLAMIMRAKQCPDWFKPEDKSEVANIISYIQFYSHYNSYYSRSSKTALRIH